MNLQLTVDDLYRVLLFIGMTLLIILLYNTLVLYRRKIDDWLSLMLIASMITCAFEMIWEYCDGKPELSVLSYIGGCGYVIAFLSFTTYFNRFFLDQFGILPKKKWVHILLYRFPVILFVLICITTPWTRLLFWVDEKGILQEMSLFSTLFYGVLLVYLFAAILPAAWFAVSGRYRNQTVKQLARSLIIFGVLGPAIFLLEIVVLGNADSDYLAISTPIAIALVYLTTNVNTHLLLEKQAEVEAVESDLRIAAKIQTDALPPIAPEFTDHLNLNLRASMNTAREVGGDFYDYFAIDGHHLCMLIADVSGKGTPAALFMMTVKTMIKDYALILESTSEIFTEVNRRLCENNEAGMFATAWIGILDTQTMTLQYTNAGHNYPIFQRRGKSSEQLKKVHGLFLAGMEDTIYRQSELRLQTGDRLLLYTDGATEAHSHQKTLYGTERLKQTFEDAAEKSGEDVLDYILNDISDFAKGEPQFDDITMMILTIK